MRERTTKKQQRKEDTKQEVGNGEVGEEGKRGRSKKIRGTCWPSDLEGILHHHLSAFPGKHTFSEGKSDEDELLVRK